MPSAKRSLYPGEFTWWLNDRQPVKRRKRNANILRAYSADYRDRVKIHNENLTANAEMEMLAATQESYDALYLLYWSRIDYLNSNWNSNNFSPLKRRGQLHYPSQRTCTHGFSMLLGSKFITLFALHVGVSTIGRIYTNTSLLIMIRYTFSQFQWVSLFLLTFLVA